VSFFILNHLHKKFNEYRMRIGKSSLPPAYGDHADAETIGQFRLGYTHVVPGAFYQFRGLNFHLQASIACVKLHVNMKDKEFIVEHKRLVNTLKHPTPAKLKREARIQGKELKEKLASAKH
jgi:hypothetical protein